MINISNDLLMSSIYDEVIPLYGCASHDISHALRVAENCKLIAPSVSADLSVCMIAALLHDIGRFDRSDEDHSNTGKMIRNILSGKASSEFIDKVIKCVERHSSTSKEFPETPEEKTLFDADKLEGYGYAGIARLFMFAGENRYDMQTSLRAAIIRMERVDRKGSFLTPMGRKLGRIQTCRSYIFFLNMAKEYGLKDEELWFQNNLIRTQGKITAHIKVSLVRFLLS